MAEKKIYLMGFLVQLLFSTLPCQMRAVFYGSLFLIDKIIMAIFFFNSTEQLILWYLGLEK